MIIEIGRIEHGRQGDTDWATTVKIIRGDIWITGVSKPMWSNRWKYDGAARIEPDQIDQLIELLCLAKPQAGTVAT